jgi:orotidine-5'-phosphate decarboxylase
MAEQTAYDPRDRLILALDFPTVDEAEAVVGRLGDTVTFYKIGMELVYGGGLALAQRLVASGKKVFLDLKLHDIPNTVERATAQIARLGMTFLTIHGYPQTMQAAVKGRGTSSLKLLGVTVMTSYDDRDLAEAGYARGVSATVRQRAEQARSAGVDGLIIAPEEAAAMRNQFGRSLTLVTPGIRPAGAAPIDQKRVMTPRAAIEAGADFLVVGRPITTAPDWKAAAEAIIAEIKAASLN